MADDDQVNVRFGGDTSELGAASEQAKQQVQSVGESAEGAGAQFEELGNMIVEAFAIDKVVEFINHITELGEQVERTEAMTGLSAETTQKLGFAMELTGGSADRVGATMARLERNMLTASSGSGAAYDAFTRFGISLDQIRNSSPDEILKLVDDGFERLGPSIQRTADLSIVGGRGIVTMAAALKDGSAGLDEMGQKLEETGALLTEFQAQQLEQTHQQLTITGKAFEGVGISVVEILKPAIDDGAESMQHFLEELNENVKTGGIFHDMVAGLATAFEILKLAAEETCELIGAELVQLVTLFGAAADAASHFVKFDFTGGKQAWKDGMDQIDEIVAEATDRMQANLEKTNAVIQQINNPQPTYGPTKNASQQVGGVGTPDSSAADGAKAAKDAEDAQREQIQTQLTLDKIGLQSQKDTLQAEVATHQISKQQELDAETQFANEEYNLNYAALQQELAIDDQTVAQKQKVYDQIKILYAKHMEDLNKIATQGAAAQEKPYDSFFKSITSGVDGMVNGVLQGTQTWQQAMYKLFDNLILKFIDDVVVKGTVEWAQSQLAKVQAAIAADTAVTTSAVTSASVGAAAEATANKTSISGSAAKAAAAVYADVAEIPYVGWLLAPPAAAAAFVAVEAFGAGVASFDVGTNYVPQTGLAMVHQGEQIIPASGQGAPYSPSGGSGGASANINITAMDSKSVMAALNNPSTLRQLSRNIGAYMVNNPSVRGAY